MVALTFRAMHHGMQNGGSVVIKVEYLHSKRVISVDHNIDCKNPTVVFECFLSGVHPDVLSRFAPDVSVHGGEW